MLFVSSLLNSCDQRRVQKILNSIKSVNDITLESAFFENYIRYPDFTILLTNVNLKIAFNEKERDFEVSEFESIHISNGDTEHDEKYFIDFSKDFVNNYFFLTKEKVDLLFSQETTKFTRENTHNNDQIVMKKNEKKDEIGKGNYTYFKYVLKNGYLFLIQSYLKVDGKATNEFSFRLSIF